MPVQYYNYIGDLQPQSKTVTISANAIQNCFPDLPNFGEVTPYIESVTASVPRIVPSTYKYFPRTVTESKSIPDKSSFKKIRRSGEIKMTPYYNYRKETLNLLAQVPWESQDARRVNLIPRYTAGNEHCHQSPVDEIAFIRRPYMEQGDFNYWSRKFPTFALPPEDLNLQGEVNNLMSRVVSDNLMTYDLFTDLAEARSSLKTLLSLLKAVRSPLQSYKKARAVLQSKKATHDELTSLWMQYRYAIMPIIYGAQDAMDNFNNVSHVYKTSRGSVSIDLSKDSSMGNPKESFLFQKREGDISIRATGKARFSTATLRAIDQTSFNVLNTAWEVIPYSLVVDWFTNIGDWIHIHSSILSDFSSERKFCYSIRRSERVTTYLHYHRLGSDPIVLPGRTAGDVTLPNREIGGVPSSTQVVPVKVESSETYDRYIYNPSDVEISSNIQFSSWKRWLDAYVLSLGPTLNLLKKLR